MSITTSPSPEATKTIQSSLDPSELQEAVLSLSTAGQIPAFSVLLRDEQSGRFAVHLTTGSCSDHEIAAFAQAELKKILDSGCASLEPLSSPLELRDDLPKAHAVATLSFRDQPYGLFLLHEEVSTPLDVWQSFVDVLAAEVIKVQIYHASSQQSATVGQKLDALNEMGELIRYTELDVLLSKLMELSLRITNAEVGAIVLWEEDDFRTGVEWGLREEILRSLKNSNGDPLLETLSSSDSLIHVNCEDGTNQIDASESGVEIQSLVAVPLVTSSKRVGAILIVNSTTGALDPRNTDILSTVANLAASALENALLLDLTLKHEKVAAEMDLASKIQQSLLPKSAPSVPGYELEGWSMACDETGGDYYDFLELVDGKLGLVVGDATGHGMGAALTMFIVRSTLHALLTQSRDLEEIVGIMNQRMEEDSPDDRFMTFFFGVLDTETKLLRFTSAGHDPPLLYRPGATEFEELESTGLPLGVMPGGEFATCETQLQSGDCLIFGTDGIWESRDPGGKFYGTDHIFQIISENHEMPLRDISDLIRRDVVDYRGSTEQKDDITAVMLKIL